MPSVNTKILEFNQYQKCDKAPFVEKEEWLMIVKVILKIQSQKQ